MIWNKQEVLSEERFLFSGMYMYCRSILLQLRLLNGFPHKKMANKHLKTVIFFVILVEKNIFAKKKKKFDMKMHLILFKIYQNFFYTYTLKF